MIDLNALCSECGVKFYADELISENSRQIYRVYITKKNGVNLDDCEALSRLLSPILDVEPQTSGAFTLEVSSPGLERKLITPSNFENSLGELVKITLKNGEKISGEILSFKDEILKLKTAENNEISVNFNEIKKAKTYIEW